MAKCPTCGTAGAYVGFSSIECRNKDCEHFKIDDEQPCCGCCGGPHAVEGCPTYLSGSGGISEDYDDSGGNRPPPSDPNGPGNPHYNYSSPPPDWHGD